MKCPVCDCEYFYVKNPDNPYKYYQFTCKDGEVHFGAEVNKDEVPDIMDETQGSMANWLAESQLKLQEMTNDD